MKTELCADMMESLPERHGEYRKERSDTEHGNDVKWCPEKIASGSTDTVWWSAAQKDAAKFPDPDAG